MSLTYGFPSCGVCTLCEAHDKVGDFGVLGDW